MTRVFARLIPVTTKVVPQVKLILLGSIVRKESDVYFQLRRGDQLCLPDPHGSLSTSLTPTAVASANKEVEAF